MGVLANHVPAIEQLKPGVVEVVEESGGSKQFFRTFPAIDPTRGRKYCRRTPGASQLTKLECSVWRIRDGSARLCHEHQRRRGLPP